MKPSEIIDHPFAGAYAKRLGVKTPWQGHLPGPKMEAWRFTPLRTLANTPFVPASASAEVDVTELPRGVPLIAGAARLVLVNGAYREDLSDADFGPGVTISTAEAFASSSRSPLALLNAAYASAGVSIDAAGPDLRPIHLVSIGAAGAEPAAFHPRLRITVAPGASLTIIESHVGLPGQTYFSNPVTEIALAENANLRRYVSVAEDSEAFHLATATISIAAGGSLEAFHLGLGGALVRQDITVRFAGRGAAARLNGAYALSGRSHHDFTTVMDHNVPDCRSSQVFKGVADGDSHGVFQGRIHVARDAQKTDARQLHKALFLSRGPEIDCKPELEIYADDVQCAHGAATGEIDHDQLFYLMSRGIDPATARSLLVEGFLTEAVDEISVPEVQALFRDAIGAWLKSRDIARARP